MISGIFYKVDLVVSIYDPQHSKFHVIRDQYFMLNTFAIHNEIQIFQIYCSQVG